LYKALNNTLNLFKIMLMSLRLILASLFTLFSICSFGQNENANHCSKRSKHSNSIKSASLTVDQIGETELYDVHYYQLDIAMNNVQTNVAGTGEIHATAKTLLDSALFELHSNFGVSQIRVNGSPVLYSRSGSAIKVPVNAISNENFVISIDYSGVPPTAASTPFGGGGMTNASSPSWGNRVTWSLSEPFSAYEWWPCKQSLTDKADSSAVKITVPDSCKAGSNGILENIVNLGNGFSRYEWKHRHPIDYYLISVAVAKYIDYTIYANPAGAPSPIMIQNYIYDNPQTLINFQDEIDETVDFIELFYDLYGPYPFEDEKYGHCMAPLSGGMEHQTMTTQGFFEKGLTAHELGHQWWGNNVTCASWSDIWVNEGFASYSEYLMLQNLYPGQQNAHMTDVHDNVMSQPNGSTWVLDSLNENRIFSGRLTYDKGAAIIHTLRYMVDNDVLFFQTLRDFQNDFADSTARGVDIQNAFEVAIGLDLNSFFEQWYFGEGYPTYSLRWNELGDDILLQVSHTASFGGVTPTFTNPIDVRIIRSGQADTIVTVDINSNLDQFYFPGIGDATAMTIDPQNWVVNKVGTIQFDQNLLVIGETEKTEDLILYPNPSKGIFTVQTANGGKLNYSVYHMNGKIYTSGIASDGQTIDLSNANSGTYLIEIGSRKKLVNIVH
jgi:aminopeptidase N